jgi:putative hydrolase of the HAD superfamily
MINAVIFDLDGTLHDRDTAVRSLFLQQYDAFTMDLMDVTRDAFVESALFFDDHGQRRKVDVYAALCAEFGLPPSLAARLVTDFWNRYHHWCKPVPGLAETLDELHRRGKRVGVITNGTTVIQEATIDALGVRKMVDAILISETEGVRKPERAMFMRAAAKLGVPMQSCCFIGDNPELDIMGAQAAGLHVIWKRNPAFGAAPAKVPAIDSLSEVLKYVY